MRVAKTPLTGDKIDAPAACVIPFRTYCRGVVMRTQNVSEYMLVLALCLVVIVSSSISSVQSSNWTSDLFSTYSYIFNVN